MIPIEPLRGWRTGRYRLVASSAAAKGEWDAFVRKLPKAMKAVYERLSEHLLDIYGTRQFPLKGKHNKPFWEYEISGGDRLYYAVDLHQHVIVVSVMPHATRSEPMTKRVRDRRDAFDGLVAEQEAQAALRPPKPPAPVRARRRKR